MTMQNETNHLSRRALVTLAGVTVAGSVLGVGNAEGESPTGSLFDGKTLDGWIQIENSATSLPSAGITDPAAFARRLTNGPDAMSVFLRGQLQDSLKADLAAYSASSANAKALMSALVKDLNQVISGPSIYGKARFSNMVPRPKAVEVLDFKDATAGRVGPIAWQMHNAGLFDEYKDVTIEPDPKDDDPITVK